MGLPMDRNRYDRVLKACALDTDLDMLPGGDQTEIGEKGVNLSGGQKHRVALARACYADADVYLLDDPLSAVDSSVGRHLMEQCITGLLVKKTRILVTHQLQFLEHADLVVMMSEGSITAVGTYNELLEKGISFTDGRMQDDTNAENEEQDDEDIVVLSTDNVVKDVAVVDAPLKASASLQVCTGDAFLILGYSDLITMFL